jgi:hypothetical protein
MNREVLLTTRDHVGLWTVLAISGGKWTALDENTLVLPVKYGYRVEITYEPGLDLYTVRKVFVRGLKRTVKDEWTHVDASSLSEVAYTASLR